MEVIVQSDMIHSAQGFEVLRMLWKIFQFQLF